MLLPALLFVALPLQGPPGTVVKKVAGYTFVSRPRPGDRYDLEASVIVKDPKGKTVLTVKDWAASVEWFKDLGGDGVQVANISAYTGGAHCCEVDYFLRLGPHPKLLACYMMGNVSGIETQKRPGSKGLDILTGYDGFAYYHCDYADSPHVPMALRLKHGRLVDATKEFPEMLRKSYKQATADLEDNLKQYEEGVKKGEMKGGMFENNLGSPAVEIVALGLLIGNQPEGNALLKAKLSAEDLKLLDSLRPEIAKIVAERVDRLTYPTLPYVHKHLF